MGKKKVSGTTLIENPINRNVTYCKRKKGLIKKAMEISMLCNQEVELVIFDKDKSKLVVYNSSDEFNCKVVKDLCNRNYTQYRDFEKYTNVDYGEICDSKIVTSKGIVHEKIPIFETMALSKLSPISENADEQNDEVGP